MVYSVRMHPIVAAIRSLLDEHGITYTFLEHASGKTSEEMCAIRGDFSLSEGAKALIVALDNGFAQIVVPGDKKFSSSKLRKIAETKEVRFATEEELAEITDGVLPGAVPPFGNLFNIPVYADTRIFDNKRIVFNCGERTASIAMNPEDYRTVVRPIVADIAV